MISYLVFVWENYNKDRNKEFNIIMYYVCLCFEGVRG